MVIFPGFIPLDSMENPTRCQADNKDRYQLEPIETFTLQLVHTLLWNHHMLTKTGMQHRVVFQNQRVAVFPGI
ncbi:hypothetical protein D3C84_1124370 [compost metagenome]